jgi:hypothetical protein
LASLWGAQIIVSRMVPDNFIYVCGEPEFFGRMLVRQDLTVVSADKPETRELGLSMFQHEGFLLHNPNAISRIYGINT